MKVAKGEVGSPQSGTSATSTAPRQIRYWNRTLGRDEVEQVYGEAMVAWLYGTPVGQRMADWVLSGTTISKLYGAYQSSSLSKHKIEPFIEAFKIPMQDYVDTGFRSFNDFFIRPFQPGLRPFTQEAGRMPAFAEARYFAYDKVLPDQAFPVKGQHLSAAELLGRPGQKWVEEFEGGPLLLARLCPTDYHRFHFPDSGTTLEQYRVPGRLHSVNPLALKYKGEIFGTNERQVSILDTENFGKLAYIEVGAMCVGLIVQTHSSSGAFARGAEKGYFLFGASTVIVLGQPGKWIPDRDLLDQTARQKESLVRLGDGVAGRI